MIFHSITRENFESGVELPYSGSAFSAYYKGKKVVDVWGGYADAEAMAPWREDTMAVVFSATKGRNDQVLCGVSFPPGSDLAYLFAKRSYKSCAPSEIAHTPKQSCTCMFTSLPGDGKTEYTWLIVEW